MLRHDALAGKHALVCGASQGIGQACARQLAEAGARVTIISRSADKLSEALQSIPRPELEHRSEACDLGDMEAVQSLCQRLSQDIDILICNSGGPKPGPLHQADVEQLAKAFQQHVLANSKLLQTALPHMKEQRWGRVINVISTSVKAPLPGLGVSNTVRGAVANWAKTLANELGPYGITVNNILPGFTETERLQQIIQGKMKQANHSQEEVKTQLLKDVPAQRFGKADELAYACVFLASDYAGYINGINLPVDGGRTASL